MRGDGWRICRFVSRNIQDERTSGWCCAELSDSLNKIRPGVGQGTAIMRRFVDSERSARRNCQTHNPAGYRRLVVLKLYSLAVERPRFRIRREYHVPDGR